MPGQESRYLPVYSATPFLVPAFSAPTQVVLGPPSEAICSAVALACTDKGSDATPPAKRHDARTNLSFIAISSRHRTFVISGLNRTFISRPEGCLNYRDNLPLRFLAQPVLLHGKTGQIRQSLMVKQRPTPASSKPIICTGCTVPRRAHGEGMDARIRAMQEQLPDAQEPRF